MDNRLFDAARTKILKRTRYNKTRAGRRRFVQDALSDATPLWLEILIVIILSPVMVFLAAYAILKWMFTLRYPVSREGKQLLVVEKYLNDCKKYQSHEATKKAEIPDKVCTN